MAEAKEVKFLEPSGDAGAEGSAQSKFAAHDETMPSTSHWIRQFGLDVPKSDFLRLVKLKEERDRFKALVRARKDEAHALAKELYKQHRGRGRDRGRDRLQTTGLTSARSTGSLHAGSSTRRAARGSRSRAGSGGGRSFTPGHFLSGSSGASGSAVGAEFPQLEARRGGASQFGRTFHSSTHQERMKAVVRGAQSKGARLAVAAEDVRLPGEDRGVSHGVLPGSLGRQRGDGDEPATTVSGRRIMPAGVTVDELERAKGLSKSARAEEARSRVQRLHREFMELSERRELLNYELECVVAEIAARTPKGENVTDDQLVSRIPEDTWVSKSMPTLNSCLQGCCNRCGHTYDEHVKAAQEKAAQEHEAVKQQEIAALAAKGAARPSTAAAVPAESARSMRSARSARPPTAASASARQREAAAAIVKAAVARQTPRVATARSRVSASRRPSTAVRGGAVVDLEAGASARKPGTARAGDAEAQALDSARTSTPLKYDLRKPPQLFPPYVGEHYPLDMTSSTHAVTGSWINAAQPTHKLVAGVMKKASAAQHSEPVWVEGSGPCWKYVGGALGTGSAEMEVAKRKPIQQNRMFAFALDQDHTAKWPLFEHVVENRKDYTGPPRPTV